MINGNLEILFMHTIKTRCVVLLHGMLNNIQFQDWVILFQQNSFLISEFYVIENMQKKWTKEMVLKSVLYLIHP